MVSIIDPLFEFGTAVFVDFDEDDPGIDFALIRIDAEDYGKVNPSMRFWGGPTGITTRDGRIGRRRSRPASPSAARSPTA